MTSLGANTMKDQILDILAAVLIGLALCALVLHGLDALFL
jgi:hypothetical protein